MREAWLRAVAAAVKAKQLPDDDFRPHDLRRSAITRWTSFGVPRDIVMAASGHKPNGVHDGYINFSDGAAYPNVFKSWLDVAAESKVSS